jgi:hypothetical protein
LGSNLDDVATDQIHALQPAYQVKDLTCGQSADFRCARAGGKTRIEVIDVEGG